MRHEKTARRQRRIGGLLFAAMIGSLLSASAFAGEARQGGAGDEFRKGIVLHREGRFAPAAEIFDKTAKEGPESLRGEALFMSARTAAALENWEEAERLFARAEEAFPDLADYAAFFRGEALRKKNEKEKALRVFQDLVEKYPESLLVDSARLQMAEISLEEGEYERAFSLSARVLEENGTREPAVQARFLLARAKEGAGDWGEAARHYLEIWLRHPLHAGAKAARDKYEALLAGKRIPPVEVASEVSFRRTQILYRARQYDTALAEMDRLEGLPLQAYPPGYRGEPWIDEFYFQRGVIHFWRKRFHQAEASFALVVENSRSPEAAERSFFWRLRAMERLGRWEEVLDLAEAFPKKYPEGENRDRVLQLKAQILEDRGRTEEAVSAYREIAAKFPKGPLVLPSLWKAGWLLLEREEWEEAVKTWETAESLRATSPWSEKALYWRGKALEKGGKKDPAEEIFRRLRREFPTSYHARLAAGRGDSRGREEGFRPFRDGGPPQAAGSGLGEVQNPRLKKGKLLSRLNLFPEATAELEATERNGNPGEETRLEAARVFREMGEYHRSNLLVRRHFSLRPLTASPSPRDLSLQFLAYPLGNPAWINRYAENRNLDPALLCAVILEESRFDPQALSVAGARGLMQIMPATGKDIAKSLKVRPFRADGLYDPELNIRFGSWYLARLLKEFEGKTYLAVAAYNAGPRAVRNWLARFPGLSEDEFVERIPYLETRNYVVRVLTSRQVYDFLYRGEMRNLP